MCCVSLKSKLTCFPETEMTETKILAVQSGEIQDIEELEELEEKLEKMFYWLPDLKKYLCSLCGQKSRFKGHAKEHAETHIKGLSFPCQNCTKIYNSRNSFRTHLIKNRCIKPKTKNLAVQSGVIQEEIEELKELEEKLEKMFYRLPDLKYLCSLCGQKSRFRGHAKEHAETHIKGLSFPCQNCTKIYNSRNSFRTHLIRNKCKIRK